MTMRRRELLLAPALALKAAAAPAKGEIRNKQEGVAYRRLGRTNFLISEVVMGGNTISPTNHEHVLRALDMGLNYLDTAPAYGNLQSEMGYAHVLKARKRDQFFLNSKISVWDVNRAKVNRDLFDSLDATEQKRLKHLAQEEIERRQADAPEYLGGYFPSQLPEIQASTLANVMEKQYGHRIDRRKNYHDIILKSVDETLTRLGTDHLDLLMCPHGASTPHELTGHPEVLEAFEKVRKAGKARYLGVSAHNDPAGILEAAVKAKVYSVAMVAYNIANAPWVEPALAAAHKADLGVIAMKVARAVNPGRTPPVAAPAHRVEKLQSLVPGDLKLPQKAYIWALRNPNLTAVISEMITHEHVKENVALAAKQAG
jgi:aryl-alcohol dehydrogenase-like predicted oxidoreductase